MARMVEIFLLGGAIGIGLAVWWWSRLLQDSSKQRDDHVNRAPEVLDETFDGRPVLVVHASRATLPMETWLTGAHERGYRLTHQSEPDTLGTKTLTFERVTP